MAHKRNITNKPVAGVFLESSKVLRCFWPLRFLRFKVFRVSIRIERERDREIFAAFLGF